MIASGTHTLADQGNSKANTIRSLANSPQNQTLLAGLSAADMLQLRQKTTNPFAAMGGEPEQTLETLVYRAVAAMDAHNRITDLVEAYGQETLDQIPSQATLEIQAPGNAVTVADLERIAFDTPGTRIARVRAWRNHHALLPCLHASGFVTVVVIPDMPVPRPLPSAGLIEAVRRYLDRRRIVCTQVVVTGPKYVEIRVLASVTLKTGASSTRVLAAIKSAIDDFLDARIGGPQGRGWPFGRSIYRSEMLQLIDDIPGVDHVVSLTMTADSSTPQCGDIRLCNTWLPSHGAHKLEIA
ncbi:MAG: baseplate J/gp47 family protein [Bryobacteraceae bacterium]